MSKLQASGTGSSNRAGSRFWKEKAPYLGVVPFLTLSGLFLIFPTVYVMIGAFRDLNGKPSTKVLFSIFNDPASRHAFANTLIVSSRTALLGAIFGALLTWAIASGKDGYFRKFSMSLAGVLSQFGGVMLTFAFLATFGFNGLVSAYMLKHFPNNPISQSTWLYGMNGLTVVYTFFQIPLMFLVFFPTFENMKKEWREANDSLGGNTREYWFRVGFPVLLPSFLGATLLLFSNAFSAYATAASLITSGTFITPLQIADALSSEVGGANAATASSLAFYMVVVVIIVMTIYSLIRRRVSRWEQSK